jgi:hypothetical protein
MRHAPSALALALAAALLSAPTSAAAKPPGQRLRVIVRPQPI